MVTSEGRSLIVAILRSSDRSLVTPHRLSYELVPCGVLGLAATLDLRATTLLVNEGRESSKLYQRR